MLLFALMAVLLLAIAGLAVDSGISYLSSDQVERAAAAAALAGVAYLPGDAPDATNAALVEAARNGFANAGSGGSSCPGSPEPSPCVVVTQPATNELKVTISVSVPTTFLTLVGFGAHVVTRDATAEYLPPIALGQPGNSLGSALSSASGCSGIPTTLAAGTYCTHPTSGLGSGGNNFYILRSEAWGVARSQGDPFTPTPNGPTGGCPPDGVGSGSCVASPPDYHQISPIYGTENSVSNTNNDGGQNYLISVPPGQTADVQIYNPSFAPNTDDNGDATDYTLHEDDSDFPDYTGGTDTTQSDYATMSYTLFQVPTLASRLSDTEVAQQRFYPFNATGLENNGPLGSSGTDSYFYWKNPSGADTLTTVPAAGQHLTTVPAMFHNWVSAVEPSEQLGAPDPNSTIDSQLYSSTGGMTYGSGTTCTTSAACYLQNTSSVTEYFRLQVDTLSAKGLTITANSTTSSNPQDETTGQALAHKAYSVRVVAPPSVAGATCTGCSVSAMDDMTVYTPVQGSQCQNFQIPLFYLDPSYAGQNITVDLFDLGDVNNAAAYVGLVPPTDSGVTAATCSTPPSAYAQMPSGQKIQDVGTSLAGGTSYGGQTNAAGTSVDPGGTATDDVIQTAGSTGGSLWNGQWLQFEIQVPSGYTLPGSCGTAPTTACYWDMYYSVASNATAGDTFAVTAGFNGSPDRLLP